MSRLIQVDPHQLVILPDYPTQAPRSCAWFTCTPIGISLPGTSGAFHHTHLLQRSPRESSLFNLKTSSLNSWKSESITSASDSRAVSHLPVILSAGMSCPPLILISFPYLWGVGKKKKTPGRLQRKQKQGGPILSLVISDQVGCPLPKHPRQHPAHSPGAPQAFQCHGQGIAPAHCAPCARAQAARGRRGGQDDATEDKGRTGEKGEGDGRENVMERDQGTNLDISREAFGPTGRKTLFSCSSRTFYMKKKNKGKRSRMT